VRKRFVSAATIIHRLSFLNPNGPRVADCRDMPPQDFIGKILSSGAPQKDFNNKNLALVWGAKKKLKKKSATHV
jgi:hypothetical protein